MLIVFIFLTFPFLLILDFFLVTGCYLKVVVVTVVVSSDLVWLYMKGSN